MKVTKVYFDSCDSWVVNTKYLKTIAKDKESAIKFIMQYSNVSYEKASQELINGPYWSIEEVDIFE